MSRKSLEYWASPASSEYEANCDRYYSLGAQAAANGQKPNAKGIYGTYRTLYFLGYKQAALVAA